MAHGYDGLTQLHGTNAQSDGQKLQINCRGKSKNHYENKIKPGVLGGNHGGGAGGLAHAHDYIRSRDQHGPTVPHGELDSAF